MKFRTVEKLGESGPVYKVECTNGKTYVVKGLGEKTVAEHEKKIANRVRGHDCDVKRRRSIWLGENWRPV